MNKTYMIRNDYYREGKGGENRNKIYRITHYTVRNAGVEMTFRPMCGQARLLRRDYGTKNIGIKFLLQNTNNSHQLFKPTTQTLYVVLSYNYNCCSLANRCLLDCDACGLVCGWKCFEGTYHNHLQGKYGCDRCFSNVGNHLQDHETSIKTQWTYSLL